MDDTELAALHLRLFEPGRSDGSRNEAAAALVEAVRGERERADRNMDELLAALEAKALYEKEAAGGA